MAKATTSRTRKVGPTPIIGPVLGQKSSFVARITDGRTSRTGGGRTAEEAERNAKRKWDRR